MRILPVVLLLLAGCQGVVGPVQRTTNPPATVGAPGLPPEEQEARIRQNLPFGSISDREGPRTYFDNPLTRSGR